MAKVFENEWMLDDLKNHPSFRTKSMFGGLAVYIFEKQVMVIVEPTKSGTWSWHGVLICTDKEHHESLAQDLPGAAPHIEGVKKWMYLDSSYENFEDTAEKLTTLIEKNDSRIGIFPKPKKRKSNQNEAS